MLTIVEFVDFECPFCRQFAIDRLPKLLSRFPSVAVIVRQRPISYHRFGIPAARAAECAAQQGRYDEYAQLLFAKQDSLGLVTFDRIADDAQLPDLREFTACYSAQRDFATLRDDTIASNQLGIHATPAFLINGLLFSGAPDSAALDAMITEGLRHVR